MSLLQVQHLTKHFPLPSRSFFRRSTDVVKALTDVSFEVGAGQIVTLTGEAASGKTILARLLIALVRPTAGSVSFDGQNLTKLSDGALRPLRRRLQMLFSDPRTALDPRRLVREIMLEPLQIQHIGTDAEQLETVKHAMRRVGLNLVLLEQKMTDLAAGERQRVALARVLTLHPQLIVCDDPTRALPPGTAEKFFKLLADLRHREGMTLIWLVQNPQPAAQFTDQLGVLYRGQIVEWGAPQAVLKSPQHPYTRQWLGSHTVPSAAADSLLTGCQFHPDCPQVMPHCRERVPGLLATPASQQAACWLYEK